MQDIKVIGQEKVGNIKFTGIEGGFGKDKKAMLVKDIAQIHESSVTRINELINRNRKRFKNGLDIIDLLEIKNFAIVLNDSGFSQNQINASTNIYLLSERGYAKLLKILEDDKAWEIYDQIVDGYFNQRAALKSGQPELVDNGRAKRLSIMADNSNTRQASLMYRIAMATNSDTGRENLLARAAEKLTGEMILPSQKQKEYSAKQVADVIGHGITAQRVGLISNQLDLKAEQPEQNEYGRWANSKSKYSSKEVPQWLYFDKGLRAIKTAWKESDKYKET